MTLSELQRLTNDQLIEKVAIEVMGWDVPWITEKGITGVRNKRLQYQQLPSIWNPLTDWNHTMEVWQQGRNRDHKLNIFPEWTPWDFDDGHRSEEYTHVSEGMCDDFGCGDSCVTDKDPRRAICLAALLALQP